MSEADWHSRSNMVIMMSVAEGGVPNLANQSFLILLICPSCSILLARTFSSLAFRRDTLPISRRYMRTGSSMTSCASSSGTFSSGVFPTAVSGSISSPGSSSSAGSAACCSGQAAWCFTSSLNIALPEKAAYRSASDSRACSGPISLSECSTPRFRFSSLSISSCSPEVIVVSLFVLSSLFQTGLLTG
ncbi:hypothetical protein ES703_15075 [subsurface metagenome]